MYAVYPRVVCVRRVPVSSLCVRRVPVGGDCVRGVSLESKAFARCVPVSSECVRRLPKGRLYSVGHEHSHSHWSNTTLNINTR